MKEKLGDFTIQEQIDPGAYTIVYHATQEMGMGITRPAAIKVLQTMKLDDAERVEALKREVGMLIEVSNSPNIVTVLGFGIDEDEGPWIAMELAGRSLKHFIQAKPAGPEDVRVLLRDTLRALAVVHGTKPPIIHRDLKPNNILSTKYGIWQLADFSLAKRQDTDDTLEVMTVKYAAPEMLDAQLGEDSPKMDIYSLGMVAYEYALGTELHRQQFPSIYDPQGGGDADDRPKWMYWHTSMQMTAPPLAEVIPDYPKDISDLIVAMTAKQPRERIESAERALEQLGQVYGSVRHSIEEKIGPDANKGKATRRTIIIAAAAGVLLLAAVAYFFLRDAASRPEILLAQEDVWVANGPSVEVTGKIANYPAGGSAQVRLADLSTCQVFVDDAGEFRSDVRVPKLGETTAFLSVYDPLGDEVGNRMIRLTRSPPTQVEVEIATRPVVGGAEITLTNRDKPDQPIHLKSDVNGIATGQVPFGSFDLEVSHPRFGREVATYNTGIDPKLKITYRLTPIAEENLDRKRGDLLDEMDDIVDEAVAGDDDNVARLKEIRSRLKDLAPDTAEEGGELKVPLFQELDEVSGLALNGERGAIARVHDLNREFKEIAGGEAGSSGGAGSDASAPGRYVDPKSPEGRRIALVNEMGDLAERAANGDRSAAARLEQVRSELAALSESELGGDTAARRAALVREMESLTERAANGDKDAIARLAEVKDELQALTAGDRSTAGNPRRRALLNEMEGLAERAAAGDEAAAERIRQIQGELAQMDASDGARGSRRDRLVAEMDQLAARAAAGDPAAIARIQQIQSELERIDADQATVSADAARAERRRALLAESEELAKRAAAGDPDAKARLTEVSAELAKLEGEEASRVGAPSRDRRAALIAEMEQLAERAANGDPAAIARLAEIREQLAAEDAPANAPGGTASRRAALLRELDGLTARAAAGDPAAAKRIQEITGELGRIEAEAALAAGQDPAATRRAALAAEAADLAKRAAAGDKAAAARLAEVQKELAALDGDAALEADQRSNGAKRAALLAEMDELAERAAAGDPVAQARMAEIQKELRTLNAEQVAEAGEGKNAERRAALLNEMSGLAARAAAGDPAAIARMQEIQAELDGLDAAEVAANTGGATARRAALAREMAELAERAAAGDPTAKARMAEIQKELDRITEEELAGATPDGNAARRTAAIERLDSAVTKLAAGDRRAAADVTAIHDDLSRIDAEEKASKAAALGESRRAALTAEIGDLARRAAAGDKQAAKRVAEVQRELREVAAADAATNAPESGTSKRQALVAELADVAKRAAAGDPEAIARLAEIQQELAALDDAEPAAGSRAARRAALIAELADVTKRAAAGDPQAIARLAEIQGELAALDAAAPTSPGASRREALVAELADVAKRAAAGDPKAIARLAAIQQELASIDSDGSNPEVDARRAALVAEMGDLAERAKNGDPAAIARIQQIQAELAQLDDQERDESVAGRRAALVAEMDDLAERAKNGDPAAIRRLQEIQGELAQLEAEEKAGSAAGRRAALVAEMADLAERAKNGDPAAIRRLQEIQGELAQLDQQEQSESIAGRRAALVAEMDDLAKRAAAGDPAAVKRLQEIQAELAQLDAEEKSESVAGRRAALVAEMDDLAKRAAAGDPAAVKRLQEIQAELAQLDQEDAASSPAARRAALVAEMEDLAKRAAAGDPAAVKRLQEIQAELAQLDQEEAAGKAAAKRANLVAEMESLAERAANGDPAAIARIAEIQQELAKIDADEAAQGAVARRAALVDEMAELADRVAAGDPAAIARMAEIQQELAKIDAEDAAQETDARRAALVAEMNDLAERAANGDPAAIARMRQIQAELAQLDEEEGANSTAARRAALVDEMASLAERAAAGDPAAIARMAEIREELAQLNDEEKANSVAGRRAELVQELGEVAERVGAGDQAANARLVEIQSDLAKLEDEEDDDSAEARRRALLAEMAALTQRAAQVTQQWQQAAAIARLRQVHERLKDLEESESYDSAAARRAALIREMEDLSARAAAGDPEAIARLREIQRELAMLEGGTLAPAGEAVAAGDNAGATKGFATSPAARRAELIRELEPLADRIGAGDVSVLDRIGGIQRELLQLETREPSGSALARRRGELIGELGVMVELARTGETTSMTRIPTIQRELAALSLIESATADPGMADASGLLEQEQMSLDLIDRTTLMQLTANEFKTFIELNIPTGSLRVETVPHVHKIRVIGPVFNGDEMARINARLAPAMPRLHFEIRVDPWAVCRRLQETLVQRGATDVRVHAHLTPGDNAIYVQYARAGVFDDDRVHSLARPFVIDPDLLFVQGFVADAGEESARR